LILVANPRESLNGQGHTGRAAVCSDHQIYGVVSRWGLGTCRDKGVDLRSDFIGAVQQLLCAEGRFAGSVFVFYAVSAPRLAQVLPQ
jgi:hypothetical protein